jgi:hypothetical protein
VCLFFFLLSDGCKHFQAVQKILEKQNKNEGCVWVFRAVNLYILVNPFSMLYHRASRSGLENQMKKKIQTNCKSSYSLTDLRPSSCVFGNLWRVRRIQGGSNATIKFFWTLSELQMEMHHFSRLTTTPSYD